MAFIKVIKYINGLPIEIDPQNDSIFAKSVKIGGTLGTELTQTILNTLVGGNATDAASLHNHDSTYFRKTEFVSVSTGIPDAGKPVKLDSNGRIDGSNVSAGGITHGQLAGLTADDHTQYHNNTRGDARYYQQSQFIALSSGAGDASKPIKTNAQGKVDSTFIIETAINHENLAGLQGGASGDHMHITAAEHSLIYGGGDATSAHHHDSRYYTQAQVDAALALKADDNTVVKKDGSSTMTGDLNVGGNKVVGLGAPSAGSDATNKTYVDAGIAASAATKVSKAGDTMSGSLNMGGNSIINLPNPTDPAEPATKGYVDAARQRLLVKDPVLAASTGNLSLSGLAPIDGITPVAGSRILVKDQTDPVENGIYDAASGAWARSADADENGELVDGTYVWVEEGTVNGNSQYIITSDNPLVVGTDPISFVKFSGAGSITAGNGIQKTGDTISAKISTGLAFNMSGAITLDLSGSAGAGLAALGPVLAVNVGEGIKIGDGSSVALAFNHDKALNINPINGLEVNVNEMKGLVIQPALHVPQPDLPANGADLSFSFNANPSEGDTIEFSHPTLFPDVTFEFTADPMSYAGPNTPVEIGVDLDTTVSNFLAVFATSLSYFPAPVYASPHIAFHTQDADGAAGNMAKVTDNFVADVTWDVGIDNGDGSWSFINGQDAQPQPDLITPSEIETKIAYGLKYSGTGEIEVDDDVIASDADLAAAVATINAAIATEAAARAAEDATFVKLDGSRTMTGNLQIGDIAPIVANPVPGRYLVVGKQGDMSGAIVQADDGSNPVVETMIGSWAGSGFHGGWVGTNSDHYFSLCVNFLNKLSILTNNHTQLYGDGSGDTQPRNDQPAALTIFQNSGSSDDFLRFVNEIDDTLISFMSNGDIDLHSHNLLNFNYATSPSNLDFWVGQNFHVLKGDASSYLFRVRTLDDAIDMIATLDMSSHQIKSVADPTDPQDAATRAFVDAGDSNTLASATSLVNAEAAARAAEDLTFLKLDGSRNMDQRLNIGNGTNVPFEGDPSDFGMFINSEADEVIRLHMISGGAEAGLAVGKAAFPHLWMGSYTGHFYLYTGQQYNAARLKYNGGFEIGNTGDNIEIPDTLLRLAGYNHSNSFFKIDDNIIGDVLEVLSNGSMSLNFPLVMNGQRITNLATPTAGTDASNKDYVDTQISSAVSTEAATRAAEDLTFIKKDGSRAFTGNQSMGSNRLTNLANATSASDATPLSQVQSEISAAVATEAAARAAADAAIAAEDATFVKLDGSRNMTGSLVLGPGYTGGPYTGLADGPNLILAADDSATREIRFANNDGQAYAWFGTAGGSPQFWVGTQTALPFHLTTNDQNRLSITADGTIGIGYGYNPSIDPNIILQIFGANQSGDAFRLFKDGMFQLGDVDEVNSGRYFRYRPDIDGDEYVLHGYLNVHGHTIHQVGTPGASDHAANKGYVDGEIATEAAARAAEDLTFIKLNGTRAFTADQPMGGNRLTGLGAPTNANDAARKQDVDAVSSALSTETANRIAADNALTSYIDSQIMAVGTNTEWQDSVISRSANPPGSPSTGDRYLVIATATGAWVGQEDKIAEWNGSSYDYTTPHTGTFVSVDNEPNKFYYYNGSAWVMYSLEATTASYGLEKVGLDIRTKLDPLTSCLFVQMDDTLAVMVDGQGIVRSASGLMLQLRAGGALTVTGSGLGVDDAAITEDHLAASVAGDGLVGGNGLPLAVNPGLGLDIDTDQVIAKLKAAGGILVDANGLYVDTSIIATKAYADAEGTDLATASTIMRRDANADTRVRAILNAAGSFVLRASDATLYDGTGGLAIDLAARKLASTGPYTFQWDTTGNKLLAQLDANSQAIKNVPTPSASGDAANKSYVDAEASARAAADAAIQLQIDERFLESFQNGDGVSHAAGDVVYMASDGKVYKAQADNVDIDEFTFIMVAAETVASSATGKYVCKPGAKIDGLSGLTINDPLYISATVAGTTQQDLTGFSAGNKVVTVGKIISATSYIYWPNYEFQY